MRVAEAEGLPEARLSMGGLVLDGEARVSELVEEEATLSIFLGLLGGGKKRKKKTYTTPKKVKAKYKNTPLATLKYYNVKEDGKVEKVRQECPHPMCGVGVFMAEHRDRYYCGKCSRQYLKEE